MREPGVTHCRASVVTGASSSLRARRTVRWRSSKRAAAAAKTPPRCLCLHPACVSVAKAAGLPRGRCANCTGCPVPSSASFHAVSEIMQKEVRWLGFMRTRMFNNWERLDSVLCVILRALSHVLRGAWAWGDCLAQRSHAIQAKLESEQHTLLAYEH